MPFPFARSLSSLPAHLHHVARYNLHTLRTAPLPEISGALGDLPTFLPLFLALTERRLIAPGATLVVAGLTNVYTGLVFGIPLPVQPMKAIAAAALLPASDLRAADVASAGIFVGACVALLTLTGTLERFTRSLPRSVVRGVQLGAGLGLAVGAAGTMRDGLADDPGVLLVALAMLVPATLHPRRVPYVLILVGLSILGPLVVAAIACAVRHDCADARWAFALWKPRIRVPDGRQFARGALGPGLGQLPLTTLNSVVAVVYLAHDLYPNAAGGRAGAEASQADAPLPAEPTGGREAEPETPGQKPEPAPDAATPPRLPTATAIGLSLLLPNLLGPFLHALPVCHGSGGLAAQHRFGARSGASIVLLGLLKVLLGLFASPAVQWWAEDAVPASWRGLLVFLAGIGLAQVGADVGGEEGKERREAVAVVLVTASVTLGCKHAGLGFLAGMLVWAGYRGVEWEGRRRERRREGRIRLGEERPV